MARSVAIRIAVVLLLLSASGIVGASVEAPSSYTKLQTYNGALRYLRVDLGYEVTEKDSDAAYLLFRFLPDGRKKETNGAIEIVDRHEGVRVYIRLPELPRYHEQLLSDGLFRKLRDEYGEPPRREDPPPRDRKDKDKDKDNKKEKSSDGPDAGG